MKKIVLLLVFLVCSISAWSQSVGKPSAHLNGRTYLGTLPQAVSNNPVSGVVVVTIWVDPYGNVTKAEVGAEGTKTNSDDLWNAAREAAMKTRFNQKADAPALQKGSIVYLFSEVSRTAAFPGTNRINDSYVGLKEDVDDTALKFLGIPIDGSQEFVIAQIKEKGFKDHYGNYLEGQFNGEPVKVFVHTYHDKVDRIVVEFDEVPEMDLREQYNRLLSQLSTNEKYKPLQENLPIPSDEKLYFSNTEHKARFGYYSDGQEMNDGEVWLAITNRTDYRVSLFYDNLKNRPHGEDL